MPISTRHPDYEAVRTDWDEARDAFKGERHVKGKGRQYLPATVGMVLDGMEQATNPGRIAYEGYKMRAQFPDYMQVGVETLVGILNAKPYDVTVPAGMEYLLQKASNKGETIFDLLRRIHTEQVTTGRVGVLADLPTNVDPSKPHPYLALYNAESIINWDDSNDNQDKNTLNLVVLDETTNVRSPGSLSWEAVERYRVLALGPVASNETSGIYRQGVFEGTNVEYVETNLTTPMLRGVALKEIPFVFINAKDTLVQPDLPPLIGLARLCMSIYRSEADYRQALFLQGQDTLVVVGGMSQTDGSGNVAPTRVGAGAKIDVDLGGDAKYIGISSQGLPEMRTALENDRKAASVRTGQLLAPGKMSMESGEALKTRIAAQTATLTSVALASAAGLAQALRHIAVWLGKDPAGVKVIPNLDFTNVEIAGQDIVQLITAKTLGFPLSAETLHRIARERGLTKLTFEEEMKAIDNDPAALTEYAMKLAAGLKGNNPLESAGGPKKAPADSGEAKPPSNAPKK